MYPITKNSFLQLQRYRYNGTIPYVYSTFRLPPYTTSNCRFCDFTENYRERLASEWCPLQKEKINPPACLQSPTIYHTHLGLLPNYGGHVPGIDFSYGRTFGSQTVDAKRCLRPDYMF